MWAARAAWAACSGERPAVLAPSDSSTMRAGGGSVSACWSKLAIASSELKTASPMAVAGPVCRLRMPLSTVWWSVVGATSTEAEPSKATRPTLNLAGRRSTKATAPCLAASSRLGSTSVADIELETSSAIMTVARSLGTLAWAAGRANASTSTPSITRNTAAGRCRRQPGPRGATLSSRAMLLKRTPYRLRRRSSATTYRPASPATAASSQSRSGAKKLKRHLPWAPCRRLRVALAHAPAAGRHLTAAAGLGVDQGEHAHVGQLQLARVQDLDRQHLVARCQAPQRPLPGRRVGVVHAVEEIGDHHHQAAAPSGAAQAVDGIAQRWPAGRALGRPGERQQRPQHREQRAAAGAGREAPHPAGMRDVRAEAVAAVRGQEADRGDRRGRQVALLRVGGAEVHAAAGVDQRPRLQLSVGDQVAHVRHGGAGGDVPVHPPDVVLAGAVGAGLGHLAARSGQQSQVVAVEEPVDAPGHPQLQPPQHLLGGLELGARPGHADARSPSGGPSTNCRGATWGSGTAWRMRSTIPVAGTASASASSVSTSRWPITPLATS